MEASINGFCPHLNQENTITVNYGKIPILRKNGYDYKKFSYVCEHSDDCSHSATNKCPLFDNAQTIITE